MIDVEEKETLREMKEKDGRASGAAVYRHAANPFPSRILECSCRASCWLFHHGLGWGGLSARATRAFIQVLARAHAHTSPN